MGWMEIGVLKKEIGNWGALLKNSICEIMTMATKFPNVWNHSFSDTFVLHNPA